MLRCVKYIITRASADAWAKHRQKQGQNPGLIFDRFAPDWSDAAPRKREGLEQVAQAAGMPDLKLLEAWRARWEATVRAAGAEPFPLRTEWRLVAGLGRSGPLEVGFTFHRYGFPVLPGSSLKGLGRSAALTTLARELDLSRLEELDRLLSLENEQECHKQIAERYHNIGEAAQRLTSEFRVIFGTTAAAGRAIFFDAIPGQPPRLELDIMNPHYPGYYSGASGPTDWQNPVPVYFLTVAADTLFRFAVGWRGHLDEAGSSLRDLARHWLVRGLTELGAGGKTSAGYGYFHHPQGPRATHGG